MIYLVLDTIDKSILLSLGEGITTNQPVFTSHYYDSLESNIEEKSFDGDLNGVTYVTAVDPPQFSVKRVVKEITVFNNDTVSHKFILTLNNDGDKRIISTFYVSAGFSATVSTENYRGDMGVQGVQGSQGNQGFQGDGTEKITFNEQIVDSYTFVSTDAGKLVRINNSNTITALIDVNANQPMQIGSIISIEQKGTGIIIVTPETGVIINSLARKTWGQYSVIQIYKVDTDTWNVIGGIE